MEIQIAQQVIPATYSPPQGYKWKILSIVIQVTGTSTADSVVTCNLYRGGNGVTGTSIPNILLSVTSSSTVLTVSGSVEFSSGSSSPIYHPVEVFPTDTLSFTGTNSGSVLIILSMEEVTV